MIQKRSYYARWLAMLMMLAVAVSLLGCTGITRATPTVDSAPTQTRAAELTQIATLAAPTATSVPASPTSTAPLAATPTTVAPPTPTMTAAATATSPVTPTRATGETTALTVYFLRDEKIAAAQRQVPATRAVGEAALRALLAGPTREERDFGFSTQIPDDTTFLGLTIENGIATVNLSREYAGGGGSLSMMARLAQVVFTLTQFPTVDRVQFQLAGQPVTVFGGEGIVLDRPVNRANYEKLSPAILVESPTAGETVTSPLRIRGTANTFEAVFMVNIVGADGRLIAERVVMATSGSGTRGTFDITVPYTVERGGRGTLCVFEHSAKDGTPINIVEIPLELRQ